MTDAPFGTGLQPEQTLLAWRRTCLALAVGATITIRLGAPTLGFAAGIIGIVSLGFAAAAASYAMSTARYHRVHLELSASHALPGAGTQITLIALGVVLFGVLAAAWVIVVGLDRLL